MENLASYGFAILVGFALSAACGLRIFAPLAMVSIGLHFGWINPGPGFAWLGSLPAMVCLACACVVEIFGMLIPWLDHALDVAGAPIAALAGTVIMAAQLAAASGLDTSTVPPWLTGTLAIVVGGGAAFSVHAATGTLRAGSTAVSGGLFNPLFALAETFSSLLLAGLAIILPLLAVLVAISFIIALSAMVYWARQWRQRPNQ